MLANLTRGSLTALYNERLNLWQKVDRLTADGAYVSANLLQDYIDDVLSPRIHRTEGL